MKCGSRSTSDPRWRLPKPFLIYGKGVAIAEYDGALDYVLEFTDVAWPVV